MELSLTAVLALFTLLVLSSGVFYVAQRLRLPYTVLLVAVGLLLVPVVHLPGLSVVFGFLDDLQLTSELLFYIFLPVLIFESGYNMRIRKLAENLWTVGLLAVVSLMISAALVVGLLHLALTALGFDIPLIVLALFAAIISATDPVAVLALFKEVGAPQRLTMLFEGESLFNDGTAVALFLVVMGVASDGYHGGETILLGVLSFIGMVVLGVLLGLAMGAVFSRVVRRLSDNPFVAATLLIVSAHVVFILCELINEHGVAGVHVHVSSIIATTTSSLFLGNHTRHCLDPESEDYVGRTVEHLAFVVNSLVFLLAGLLFASLDVDYLRLWPAMLAAVLVVMVARAVSVYAVTLPLSAARVEGGMPAAWSHLLAWGSLRGALAIIVVRLVPADLRVPGWNLPESPRDVVTALTIACILTTLFLKAPTIAPLVRRLGVDRPEPLTQAYAADLAVYQLTSEAARFAHHRERGFLAGMPAEGLARQIGDRLERARTDRERLRETLGDAPFTASCGLIATRIERHYLDELYLNHELSEDVYRRQSGRLALQDERLERGHELSVRLHEHDDRRDLIERLVTAARRLVGAGGLPLTDQLDERRVQVILTRKTVKAMQQMQRGSGTPVFRAQDWEATIAAYEQAHREADVARVRLEQEHAEQLRPHLDWLGQRTLHAAGRPARRFMHRFDLADETLLRDLETVDGLPVPRETAEQWGPR